MGWERHRRAGGGEGVGGLTMSRRARPGDALYRRVFIVRVILGDEDKRVGCENPQQTAKKELKEQSPCLPSPTFSRLHPCLYSPFLSH